MATKKQIPQPPPAALPPLGPPHYRGPQGDTTDAATVELIERLKAIKAGFEAKEHDNE